MSCKQRKSKKKDAVKSDSILEEAKKVDEKQQKVFGAQYDCHPPNYFYPQPHPIPCPYYPTMPPPVPPCSLDNENLWDLQFCRWWGWNWVRKKEEFLKQKNYKKCQTQVELMNEKMLPKKESNKFKNFCLMCKNYCAKRKVREKIDPEKKKEMQWLLDTPCSSCVFYDPPNYDNRSLIFEGNIEYTSDGVAKRSLSTVYVQKGRRRKSKNELGKYQLCMRRKQQDSSSSDECCRCYSSHKYITCRNIHDNMQCLGFQMQSDSEDCCVCSRRCRCHCPCKIICYPCDMAPKERKKCKCKNMETQTKEPHVAKKFEKGTLACNFKPEFKSAKTVCHCCTCKHKKKYATVCCCKPQEIILCNCSKSKHMKRSISDTDLNQKNDNGNKNRKKITIVKSMSIQCMNQKKDQETNMNETSPNVTLEREKASSFIKPINYDDTQSLFRKIYDNSPVRKKDNALNESFVSPVSGKTYSLEEKNLVFQEENQKNVYLNPLDHNTNLEHLLNQTLHTNDDEHKELLLEICEAILKARQMQNVEVERPLNPPPLKKTPSLEDIHKFANAPFNQIVNDSVLTFPKTINPTVEIFAEDSTDEPFRYSTIDPVFQEAYDHSHDPNDGADKRSADVNSYFKNGTENYELYPVYKTNLDLEKRIQLYLRMPPQPPPSLTKYFPNYHNLLQHEETVQTQTGESLDKFEELIKLNMNETASVNEAKEDKTDYIDLATSTNMLQPEYSEKILSAVNIIGEDASTSMNISDFVIKQDESTVYSAISTQSAGMQFQTELATRGTSPNLDYLKQQSVSENEPLKKDGKKSVVKRVSPFSTFCRPVPDKNITDQKSQCSSLSRPRRKLLLEKKGLKERERRWRY